MADTKPGSPPDRDLLIAMARGDAEALRTLNARYGQMLAALAKRFVNNESDAEEIVADVLWQAWRSAGSFDPSRGSVSVWLITLARSRAIDRLRAIRARERPPGAEPDADPVSDPAVELDQAERARIVRGALATLDPNERIALELAYFSDLSQSEVAAKLGIPLGTAKTRIRGAMVKLRQALSRRHE
ncbi:MAG: sigma-70 family RNA polymerase sigma factor [Candidatus Binataceae bacterium]